MQCLNSSDISRLRTIAKSYQFDCHMSSKNALMQEIISHFNDDQFVSETLDALTDTDREIIHQLILDRRTSFSWEEVSAVAQRVAQQRGCVDALNSVEYLLAHGWLFRLGMQGGKELYYIPEDVRQRIRRNLSDRLKERLKPTSLTPVAYKDEQFAIIRDTAYFLSFVNRYDVKLTQDGAIFKRQQMQLLSAMEIKEEPLGNVTWRFGYGRRFRDYPNRFALIYDYCFTRGLVQETDDQLLVLTDPGERWVTQAEMTRLLDMFKFWKALYRKPIPKLSVAVSVLVEALCSGWVYIESLTDLLRPYVDGYYYDSQEVVVEQRILRMLVHLGMVRVGQAPDGRNIVTISDLGKEVLLHVHDSGTRSESSTTLIVQPNFEIMVAADHGGRLIWDLERMAELVNVDRVRVYRLNKESIHRCMREGWGLEHIIDFLEQHAGAHLPANVSRALHRWASEFGRVAAEPVLLVSCRDEEIYREVTGLTSVEEGIVAHFPPCHFALRQTDGMHVLSLLEKMGYAPVVRSQ